MEQWINLLYLPMFIFYLVMSLKLIGSGRKYITGQLNYKPWLTPGEYHNKSVGWHFLIGSAFFIIACVPAIIGILLDVFTNQGAFLVELACLPLPIVFITAISFYILRDRILQLKPKAAIENENLGQDDV